MIYVVDAADRERFEESKETLDKTLESEGIVGKPVLIFANKQDLDGCASAPELTKELGLLERKDCSYQMTACIAKPAEGQGVDVRIGKALNWLLEVIDKDYNKLHSRVVTEKAERDRKEEEVKAARRKRAEESKALRLKEQAEAERLKKEEEERAAAGAGVAAAGDEHSSSQQGKAAAGEAWAGESKGDAGASVRAPAEVSSSTPRDQGVQKSESTPVRDAASLGLGGPHETPGKDEAPPRPSNKLPALEVSNSLAEAGSPGPGLSGRPKLGNLKPMPPPVAQPDLTLPNAMPSPVLEGKSAGGAISAAGSSL